jgi:hypothetical protein
MSTDLKYRPRPPRAVTAFDDILVATQKFLAATAVIITILIIVEIFSYSLNNQVFMLKELAAINPI